LNTWLTCTRIYCRWPSIKTSWSGVLNKMDSNLSELPTLILCPLLDSYNPTLGNDVITTQYENGMPRQRLAGVGRPHQTPVSFRHKAQHQDYILAFWRVYRARAFAMRLILDGTEL